jgi:hypothetical protein
VTDFMTGLVIQPGNNVAGLVKVPRAEMAWYRYLCATIDTDTIESFGPSPDHWTRARWSCWCDEDGKPKGKAVNEYATNLARSAGWRLDDVVVGTVVFLGGKHGLRTVPPALLDVAGRIGLDFRIVEEY